MKISVKFLSSFLKANVMKLQKLFFFYFIATFEWYILNIRVYIPLHINFLYNYPKISTTTRYFKMCTVYQNQRASLLKSYFVYTFLWNPNQLTEIRASTSGFFTRLKQKSFGSAYYFEPLSFIYIVDMSLSFLLINFGEETAKEVKK